MTLVPNQPIASTVGIIQAGRGLQPRVDAQFQWKAPDWIKLPIESIDLKILPESVQCESIDLKILPESVQ